MSAFGKIAAIAAVVGMAVGWNTQNIYTLQLNGFLLIGNILLHKGGGNP